MFAEGSKVSVSKALQKWVSQGHVWLYRKTGGRFIWLGDQLVLVTTTGAKTSKRRTSPLFGFAHGEGWVVVAAAGSDHNPSWYHNMIANPDVVVERKGRTREMVASEAAGAEREAIWKSIIEEEPSYASFQEKTTRVIPVMILEPVSVGTSTLQKHLTPSTRAGGREERSET